MLQHQTIQLFLTHRESALRKQLSGFAQDNKIVYYLMFMAFLLDSTLLTDLFYFF